MATRRRAATRRLLAALLLAGGRAVAAAPPEASLFPYRYTRETLPNGLKVFLVPMESPGLVAYYTIVRTGSRDEVECFTVFCGGVVEFAAGEIESDHAAVLEGNREVCHLK